MKKCFITKCVRLMVKLHLAYCCFHLEDGSSLQKLLSMYIVYCTMQASPLNFSLSLSIFNSTLYLPWRITFGNFTWSVVPRPIEISKIQGFMGNIGDWMSEQLFSSTALWFY